MKTALSNGRMIGLVILTLLAAGCSRVVNVTATESICRKSVEVHLVGVNRYEKDRWETVSMTDYWTPGNQLRQSAKPYTYIMRFGQGPCTQNLDAKNPIHKIWKSRNAAYLFVLADLPGIFNDQPGNADARRLRLPATDSRKCWKSTQQIKIAIESSNIVPITVPEAKCN